MSIRMARDLFISCMVLVVSACCHQYEVVASTDNNSDGQECTLGHTYLHPGDCHKFYRCDYKTSKMVTHSCPRGTFFHPALHLCYLESTQTPCHAGDLAFSTVMDDSCDPDKDKNKCFNCTTYATCISVTSTWYYGSCKDGQFCDSKTAKCSEDVPACIPFQCGDDGTFPDYANCTVYHVCKDGVDTPQTCDNGKAYNPASLLCDKDMDDKCYDLVVKCDESPQPSVLKKLPVAGDCLQYHNCDVSKEYKESLVAIYHNCPKGQFFAYNDTYASDPKGGRCLSVSADNQPPDDCKDALEEAGVHCFKSGFNPAAEACPTIAYFCSPNLQEIGNITCPDDQAYDADDCKDFADVTSCKDLCKELPLKKKNPSDCTTYFECDKVDGTPKVKKCPDGQAFNGAKGDCDDKANVPLCQSGNIPSSTTASSSTFGSTTASNTGSTPTRPSGSTSTNTGSTVTATGSTAITSPPTASTPKPFECSRTGNFPVSPGCNTHYYNCSRQQGKWVKQMKNCPPSFIFSNILLRCVKGSCPATTTSHIN